MRYDQMVIAQGVHEESAVSEIIGLFRQHKFRRPKIVGIIETLPNLDEKGNTIEGTGGRKDLFFLINNKDINKFSFCKYLYNLCWYEDIFHEKQESMYPKSFIEKYPPRW